MSGAREAPLGGVAGGVEAHDGPEVRGGTGDQRDPQQERELQRAVAFLIHSSQRRPQTEAELAAKLRQRDVADEIAAAALGRVKALGAVDDAAFARAWVDDRGNHRGYGTARLRQELLRRQVPEILVEEALTELDGRDERSVATELARSRAQRMPASLPSETVARRLVGYLVRRGYGQALAQLVARSVTGLDRSWD